MTRSRRPAFVSIAHSPHQTHSHTQTRWGSCQCTRRITGRETHSITRHLPALEGPLLPDAERRLVDGAPIAGESEKVGAWDAGGGEEGGEEGVGFVWEGRGEV